MLTVNLCCTRCGKEFPLAVDVYRLLSYNTPPKRCPACCDEIQGRPDIVLERTTIYETAVRVHKSFVRLFTGSIDSRTGDMGGAREFRPLPTDSPSYRLTLKGNMYGACWSGRIDIFSHVRPEELSEGDVLTLSYNTTRRRVWYVEKERTVAGMTTNARRVMTTRRVPQGYVPQEGESPVKEREETNTYVLLSRTLNSTAATLQRDDLPYLCWVEAYSKTTLKGFGRQFSRRIEGTPLWYLDISGGVRSERLGTHAMLAVVDPLDPLTIVGTGDAEGRETIP